MEHQVGWDLFIKLCARIDSEDTLKAWFAFIFSHEERTSLASRVELVHELLKGEKPQREISKSLNISIAKITRGSNALKSIDPSLRDWLCRELASLTQSG